MEVLWAIHRISTPALDAVFQAVTMLGEQILLAGIFCLVYWCVDKKAGYYILVCVCLSTCVNGLVKDMVKAPRPFWQQDAPPALRAHTATGYSFPSGHTQSAASVFTAAAMLINKRWARVLAAVLTALVGFSRLYLGVHYPRDVVAGMLLGAGVSLAVWVLTKRLRSGYLAALCLLTAVGCLWVSASNDSFAAAGLMAGMLPGVLLERSRVKFSPPSGPARGLLRFAAGMLLLGAIYVVPGLFWEKSAALYFLRGAALSFAGAGGYPWLFSRVSADKGLSAG